MTRTTPSAIAVRAKFVSKEISDLIEREEFNHGQAVAPMPSEERQHIYKVTSLQTAQAQIESAIQILRGFADPLEAATPAPNIGTGVLAAIEDRYHAEITRVFALPPGLIQQYGHYNGVPVTVPVGYELVLEGEYPPADHHLRLIDIEGDPKPSWIVKRLMPGMEHPAQVYSNNRRTVLAYARKVQP